MDFAARNRQNYGPTELSPTNRTEMQQTVRHTRCCHGAKCTVKMHTSKAGWSSCVAGSPPVSLLGISVLSVLVIAPASWARSYSDAQVTGLRALFNATGGEAWLSSTGWRDASVGVCGWYGIICDSDGENVTGLHLASNALVGNISLVDPFFGLESLLDIDLSDNDLVGPVAPGFGSMPLLQKLDLSHNQLSSLPERWGSGASSLRHLFLQHNNISGGLPAAWLDVNNSGTRPIFHFQEESEWLPHLRTLYLNDNNITMTAYDALQSVTGFPSMQVVDLGGNALSGDLQYLFEHHFCVRSAQDACASGARSTRVPAVAMVSLAANKIEGGLELTNLPRSLSAFDVSGNQLSGHVPDVYAQLSVFFADGNSALRGSSIPTFAFYVNSSDQVVRHNDLVCPVIQGQGVETTSMRLRLDPSYLSYNHCVCVQGMESTAEDGCSQCTGGSYRGAEDVFAHHYCLSCPLYSSTRTVGAESITQCKCEPGFYDELSGAGQDGPSCQSCPDGASGWGDLGAISIESCSCPAGRYMDVPGATCTSCAAGTYKAIVGNDARLCLPCAPGTYSTSIGGTTIDVCNPCKAGTFSISSGATTSSACSPCPSGTFSEATGLFTPDLCVRCPAGYFSSKEGATGLDVCQPCPRGTYSSIIGASSEDACEWCADGRSSLGGSHVCEISLTNSRRTLIIYLIVGASTLAGICIAYFAWHKKVHRRKKLVVRSRTETPLKVALAKREAHMWAVFFHSLETLDVITGNALFVYLLDIGAIRGLMQFIYWLVVSIGLLLNVYRLYKVVWMKCMLANISVAEKTDAEGKHVLVVYMPGRKRTDRQIKTPDDAKMVLELVKILKHLQVNKFKVQLAVVMDLPLTFLNLYLLWMVESELILSPLFVTSLVINVFSAGKISTLIEYHLELRQRKRKLERLLMLELKTTQRRRDDECEDEWKAESCTNEEEGVDDCFEQGDPETLLKFHSQSMRNIVTKEAGEPSPPNDVRKNRKYLQLSPGRPSPKTSPSRWSQGGKVSSGRERRAAAPTLSSGLGGRPAEEDREREPRHSRKEQ